MLGEAAVDRVYLATGSTDLRKSIDGLAVLVKEGFELDPFSSCLTVETEEIVVAGEEQ